MAKYEEINPVKINENVFKLIGADWMLITAGTPESYNMMTASWGGFGVLWNKNVVFSFVRPTRHTYQFMEKADFFTISFFEEKHREILNFCGTNSGKNTDKMKVKGLTPAGTENGSVYFQEAKLVIECKTIYFDDINPKNFLESAIEGNYPKKDYHRLYIGEIIRCYKK